MRQNFKFNLPSGDLVLISSNNMKFKVHKANLLASSKMFKNMLETGTASGGMDEVRVTESSKILEQVLPYCYHKRVPPIDCTSPEFWLIIKAFDKYDIGRGLDAGIAAARLHALDHPLDAAAIIQYYLLAAFCNPGDVARSVKMVIDSRLAWDELSAAVQTGLDFGIADGGKLMSLMLRRLTILHRKRSGELTNAWVRDLQSKGHYPASSLADTLQRWAGSAECTTRAALDQYLSGKSAVVGSPPWDALRRVLDELPAKLE